MIAPELQRALAAEAALAPSVHNVQPARWRFEEGELLLLEDRSRRLPAGDPHGRDTAISLGAAAEGMAIALARRGYLMSDTPAAPLPAPAGALHPVRRFGLTSGAAADPLADAVERRYSYRGAFARPTAADRSAAIALGTPGAIVVTDQSELARIGRDYDQAGLSFFRDPAFRSELVSWMRFSRRDPRWPRDGLNAEAMAMSRPEAVGAKAVLGRALFPALDRLGLSAPLTSEASKVAGAAAMLIIHRPAEEDPFDTGRAFYRLWLRVTAAGLQGAVMASLADHPATAAALAGRFGVPPGRRISGAMRIGRPPNSVPYPRARLPLGELLV